MPPNSDLPHGSSLQLMRFWVLCNIVSAVLLWGTLLVVILKAITPAIRNRHKAESAQSALSSVKGNKDVEDALLD